MNAPIHNWSMSKESKLIRFYLWLYSTPESTDKSLAKLTFCRLFWAVVCSPITIPAILFLAAVIRTGDFVVARMPRKSKEQKKIILEKRLARMDAKSAAGPGWASRFIDKVGDITDHVSAFFQKHPGIGKTFVYPFLVLGEVLFALRFVFLIGVPLGGAAFGIDQAIVYFHGFLHGLTLGMMALGTGVIVGAILLSILTLLFKTSIGEKLGNFFEWLFLDCVWDGGVCRVGRAFKFVGSFIITAHHAIKYRTCPRITVTEA